MAPRNTAFSLVNDVERGSDSADDPKSIRYRSNTPSSTCCSKDSRDVRTMTLRGLMSRCTNPAFHIPHARHQVKQVATQARRHQRAHTAAAVDDKLPAHTVQGDALNPFHNDARHPVNRPASIQARKALQPRQQDMAFVFALERGMRGTNAALVIVLGFAITAMRKREQLERQVLALRIARMLHTARAAMMPLSLRHEQRDETTHIGRPTAGKAKAALRNPPHAQAHALNGADEAERAALVNKPAHKLMLANVSFRCAAAMLLPEAS